MEGYKIHYTASGFYLAPCKSPETGKVETTYVADTVCGRTLYHDGVIEDQPPHYEIENAPDRYCKQCFGDRG